MTLFEQNEFWAIGQCWAQLPDAGVGVYRGWEGGAYHNSEYVPAALNHRAIACEN